MSIHNILISPPFGHYLKNIANTTPVRGTFTVQPRKGIFKNALKTFRYTPAGWVNRMGLTNWGMFSFKEWNPDHIWSISVVDNFQDWLVFLHDLPADLQLELNFGCPNAHFVRPTGIMLNEFVNKFKYVSIKVPSIYNEAKLIISEAYNYGVKNFHIANTIPTNRGGLSGRKIQNTSLPLISWAKTRYSDIDVIGGGGIYSKYDIKAYADAGADKFSLATVFITCPWNLPEIFAEVKAHVRS